MAITVNIEYTLSYEDDTEQKLVIGTFAPTNPAISPTALTNKINTFNANFDSDTAALSLSKYGAKWRKISKVRVIATETTILY